MRPMLQLRFGPRAFVACSTVLAGAACAADGPSRSSPTLVVDSAGVEIVTSDALGSDRRCVLADRPTLSVGTAEGDEASMLFFVRGANRLSDGSLAVLNNGSGEIRVFSRAGTHLRSMGGHGDGPGEFRIGRFIWVLPGDTLWVGDYRPWRYHIYSARGAFVRTVDLDPPYLNASRGGGVLANGVSVNVDRPFFRPTNDFRQPEPWSVEAHDADGTLIRELARLDGVRLGTWEGAGARMSTLFDPVPSIAAAGATIAIATAREPEVRILDGEFRLRRIVRWSDPDREVTAAHIQAYRDALVERRGGRGSGNWSAADESLVSDRRPAADLFPTTAGLMLGRDGRLWVRRYGRPGDQVRWMAFRSGGEFQCHLTLDVSLTVYEFGADYLLAVHSDELRVERVVEYELHPSSAAMVSQP